MNQRKTHKIFILHVTFSLFSYYKGEESNKNSNNRAMMRTNEKKNVRIQEVQLHRELVQP